jgi:hypothetical protein
LVPTGDVLTDLTPASCIVHCLGLGDTKRFAGTFIMQAERDRERQRDRETERQRDRLG